MHIDDEFDVLANAVRGHIEILIGGTDTTVASAEGLRVAATSHSVARFASTLKDNAEALRNNAEALRRVLEACERSRRLHPGDFSDN